MELRSDTRRWWTNTPNAISIARIATTPFLLAAALQNSTHFQWLLLACLLSDILDGWIARTFDLRSSLGAILDSIADIFVNLITVVGLWVFQKETVIAHRAVVLIVLVLYLAQIAFAFLRYGRASSFHTVLIRIAAYAQRCLSYFRCSFGGFIRPFCIMRLRAYASWRVVEELVLVFLISGWTPDVGGLSIGSYPSVPRVSSMSDWLAIVNPHSGGATGRRVYDILDRLYRETRNVVFTEHPGHAIQLASNARDYDGLAVAGGDGTIFEVLQGMDRQRQALAIIPLGRGNSLARDLNLYPPTGAILPDSTMASPIDLVEVTFEDRRGSRYTVVSASTIAFGYPAEVAKVAGSDFRGFGRLSYARAAVSVAPTFRLIRVTYMSESVIERRVTGFLASNTRHVANFVAFPNARPDDGFFEVMELTSGFIGQTVHNLSSLSRLHFYSPPARNNLTNVHVTCDGPEELLIDGELYSDVVSLKLLIVGGAVSCANRWGVS